ncbi:hypothetical protein [Gimesia panareensis]|uniref:Uncharacterized protein n=1 Tax=Gimesia panareensis TaxID=2527978 RepID=A0A517Q6E2_9PLAN|nr:hypothetical protein [Gimesia panareensis]QDT27184.1 hypothetical protein Enr10x_24990 [Gimesia panareensis]QDU49966.1 hypothetical protein Pan110_23070 [Gimesia panareensis]QDV16750.1 hypothetical protein Pan153_13820 [Gimesia panareensis]
MSFSSFYQLIVKTRWWFGALLGIITTVCMFASLFKYSGGVPAFKFLMCIAGGANALIAVAGAMTFFPLIFAPKAWLVSDPLGKNWLKRTGVTGRFQIAAFRFATFIIAIAASFFCAASCMVIVGRILEMTKKSVN